MAKQKQKYNARKVSYNSMIFDSKKELKRYLELSQLATVGKVFGLKMQVKYLLIPKQKMNGRVIERECSYIADFVYRNEDGETVVEDVKGYRRGGAYSVFVIKRKLMLERYGIRIVEV